MAAYYVRYKMHGEQVKGIQVPARSKWDAYMTAQYETIPAHENGEAPYSLWVESVTYNNGNYRRFNTFEGNPV